jgi:hypothetical protein
MSGTTSNEGFPYPLTSDFADVQDAFRLATAVDSELHTDLVPLRAFLGRPSFIARQTVNSSTFTGGSSNMTFGAIDWDNTGGAVVGASYWIQPLAMAPSWWLFGGTLLINNAAAAVVGDLTMAKLNITTTDQVTGLSSQTTYHQRNDDSNTNGEWINIYAMAPVYQGSAGIVLTINGSTLKGVQAGSRIWGMQLGPVT